MNEYRCLRATESKSRQQKATKGRESKGKAHIRFRSSADGHVLNAWIVTVWLCHGAANSTEETFDKFFDLNSQKTSNKFNRNRLNRILCETLQVKGKKITISNNRLVQFREELRLA